MRSYTSILPAMLCFICATTNYLSAQTNLPDNIDVIEYFVDQDPGYGNATAVTTEFVVPLENLSIGSHTLFYRALDTSGNWSTTYAHPFIKTPKEAIAQSNIQYVELFLDEDPGYSKGNIISISPTQSTNVEHLIDLSSIAPGPHQLFVRSKSVSGGWSTTCQRAIVVRKIPRITKVHYYLNEEPDQETAGTVIEINDVSNPVTCSFTADLSDLEAGDHEIYIVAENEDGVFSNVYSGAFTIADATGTNTPELAMQIDVYPNPFIGTLQIKTKELEGLKWIKIVKSNGECIYSRTNLLNKANSEFIINTLAWSAGAYFIIISTSKGIYTETVIK